METSPEKPSREEIQRIVDAIYQDGDKVIFALLSDYAEWVRGKSAEQ